MSLTVVNSVPNYRGALKPPVRDTQLGSIGVSLTTLTGSRCEMAPRRTCAGRRSDRSEGRMSTRSAGGDAMQQISDQEIPYDRRWGQDRRLKLRHMLVSFSGADDIETAMEIAIGEIIASRKLRWSEAEYQEWAKTMLWIYQDDPKLKEALGQEETR